MANHGTILFDEINELSPQNQTLLLHFLQNKTITPLGSIHPKEIQAHIICISGRNLKEAMPEYEREYLQTVIHETSSLQEAAACLGISFSSLCRKKHVTRFITKENEEEKPRVFAAFPLHPDS